MLALAALFGYSQPAAPRRRASSPTVASAGRKKRKTIIDVKLKPGGLSRFGYHAENSTRSRHLALLRAAREEGYQPIIARLNVTATFLKNNSPRISRIFKADQRWLSAHYASVKGTAAERRGTRSVKRSASRSRSPVRRQSLATSSPRSVSPMRRSSRLTASYDSEPMYDEGEDFDYSKSAIGRDDDYDSQEEPYADEIDIDEEDDGDD